MKAVKRMDREKTLKGLECLITNEVPCEECPYMGSGYCLMNIAKDAKDLLKEQEAKAVLSERECETLPNHYERKGFCPKCHQVVEWYLNRSYCGFCGQAVKWE